jgi:hypothetical protein
MRLPWNLATPSTLRSWAEGYLLTGLMLLSSGCPMERPTSSGEISKISSLYSRPLSSETIITTSPKFPSQILKKGPLFPQDVFLEKELAEPPLFA